MTPLGRPANHSADILIVEDSPTQAQRLKHLLLQRGYHVTHAANGRVALDMVQHHKPDMVISDVIMPEMDGYELCRRLKSDPVLGDLPVILVTTLSDPGDVIRGLECRADNFILKPYDERYLVSRVQFVLLNRQMRQAEQGGLAVEIFFHGEKHVITADRMQILNLLLSTYEAAIERNKELTRAKEALIESEERTRLIVSTAHDPFVGMDSTGAINEWNAAAEKVFGWSRDEVIGRPMRDIMIPPEYRAAHDAGLAHLLRTGEGPILNARVELTALRRDGEMVPIELTVWPIQTGDTPIFNAFIRDITEQKRAAAAVQQAMAEAERANRAKSGFLSRMSHDLRTPLNAILGFAQLLEMDAATSEHREGVRHILKAGSHLLELINEVLDIARIESGHLSLSPEPVGLGDVVQHVVDLVRPLAAEREISFDVDTRALEGRTVFADRQRLNQVLLNLVANAVKYNRDKGRISIACEDVAERHVRIKVSDTGAGIPAEKLNLLFQPFERLGAEETRVEGTGLGLTLAKALTEAMGGTLGVQSEIDHGSTFWVELALADPGAEEVAFKAVSRPDAPGKDSGVAGTVLYIEDNASNRRLMERLLARRPGVRLVGMAQGQAGLDFVRGNRPDLILLDLHLPDMHGEEVLRRLWEDPRTRAIPVAVLSADATPSQAKRLRAAGAVAYLTKPIDVSEVLQLLDDNLRKASP
ncbi:MAG: response regulator [Vicinamibacterales bacterium]